MELETLMRRDEAQLLVEAQGVGPPPVRGQLDEVTSASLGARDRLLDERPPDTERTKASVDTDALDLSAPAAFVREVRQKRQLEDGGDPTVGLGDEEEVVGVVRDRGERCPVRRQAGSVGVLAHGAQRVVRKERHDRSKVGLEGFAECQIDLNDLLEVLGLIRYASL